MNGPVTYIRSEDILDESTPKRLARSFHLSRRRQLTGLALALLLLPLLTLLLDCLDDGLALDGEVLIYLLAVVTVALVGGIVVAIASAIASAPADQLFLRRAGPHPDGDRPDQVVALVVFVIVAGLVSGAIELAARQARIAERARAEAETMSVLAGPELDGAGSLHEVLERARDTFRMESVTLKVRPPGSGEWLDAEHAGWAPVGGRGPASFRYRGGSARPVRGSRTGPVRRGRAGA